MASGRFISVESCSGVSTNETMSFADSVNTPVCGSCRSRAVVIPHARNAARTGGDTPAFPEGTSSFLGHPMRSPFQRSAFPSCPDARDTSLTTALADDLMAAFTGGRSAASSSERSVLAQSPPSARMAYEPSLKSEHWDETLGSVNESVTHVAG